VGPVKGLLCVCKARASWMTGTQRLVCGRTGLPSPTRTTEE
jgi:hypothetical protein